MKEFNVLIEDNGRFKPYDIMKYLKNKWEEFIKSYKELYNDPDFDQTNEYWKYPEQYDEIKGWVDRELKYQYWSRCEYEMILSRWPYRELDIDTPKFKKGIAVIPLNEGKKIDIYEQCKINLEIITDLFIKEIYNKKSTI